MVLPHSSIAILLIIPTILGLLAVSSCKADSVLYSRKSLNGDQAASCTPNNVLYTGESLYSGQSLTWESYTFTMQTDCNLVLYDSGVPKWASGSNGGGSGCYVTMKNDGNLVIYDSKSNSVWESKTASIHYYGNYVLVLQKDRNVAIYDRPRWSTNTNQFSLTTNNVWESKADSILYSRKSLNGDQAASCTPNKSLLTGQYLTWESYTFAMLPDCNLVLYDSGVHKWASGTNGADSRCYATLQKDGNLLILESKSNFVWASNKPSVDNGNFILILQKDRNVAIYGPSRWSTNTNQFSLTTEPKIAMVTK